MKGTYNLPAPGRLESVRKLMNTWLLPSATRVPEDRLPALLRDQEGWRQTFPELPLGAGDSAELLVELRDELRQMVGSDDWLETLRRWFERFPPVVDVVTSAEATTVQHAPQPDSGVLRRFRGGRCGLVGTKAQCNDWKRARCAPRPQGYALRQAIAEEARCRPRTNSRPRCSAPRRRPSAPGPRHTTTR